MKFQSTIIECLDFQIVKYWKLISGVNLCHFVVLVFLAYELAQVQLYFY